MSDALISLATIKTVALRVSLIMVILATLTSCAVVTIGAVAVSASAVHDRRSVETVVSDQRLGLQVRQALSSSDKLDDGTDIDVAIFNGWVLLIGETQTQAQVSEATAVVKDLPGVRRLFNELIVSPKRALRESGRDGMLALQVKIAIADIKEIDDFDASRVKINVRRQVAYLQGLLTATEAQRVTEAARYVSGIEKVITVFEITD